MSTKNKINIDKNKEIKKVEENEKNKKKKYLLLLLFLFLIVFSVSVTFGKDIYETVSEQILEVLDLNKPTSPVIVNRSSKWSKESLVEVEKDSEVKDGLAYYEYCVREDKSTKNCEWTKIDTKNVKIANSGIYYVTFRGVDKEGRIGNNSNTEIVYVDNNNPVIKKINIKEVTQNSIELEVEAKDEHSGIKSYSYSLDGKNYQEGKLNYKYNNLEKDKEYTVYVKVEDEAENVTVLSMVVKTKGTEEEIEKPIESPKPTSTPSVTNKPTETVKPTESPEPTPSETPGSSSKPTPDYTDKPEVSPTPSSTPEITSTPTPTTTPDITDEPMVTPSPTPEVTPTPTPDEEEEIIVPEINLDKVPNEFSYGESYELPSYVDFKGDTGEYECIVEGKEYTDTSALKVGKHLIVCTATSSKNVRVMVEKLVTVKVGVGEESVWDGWIRLNLYYPENSTNWEWRLGTDDEIRNGYENTGWQEYTGPILVKLEDVDDVYIRYNLKGKTYVIAPNGKVAVDINPEKYTIKADEKTKVEIYYEEGLKKTEYRIGSGEWTAYTGSFEVGPNTVIEARGIKEEKVYDSEGNFLYTATNQGTDSVFIGEYVEEENSGTTGTTSGGISGSVSYTTMLSPGGLLLTSPVKGSQASTYLEGPTIASNPSTEIVNSVSVTVTPQEVAEKIYVSVDYGNYQEYTGGFEVTKNTLIKAYYIRRLDGKKSDVTYYYVENIKEENKPYVKISTTPGSYLSEEVESVEVNISGSDYETLEYSLDGVIYNTYSEPIILENSATIYARGVNSVGETVVKKVITTVTPSAPKEDLDVSIYVSPDSSEVEGLINKVTVSIDYDTKSEKKYYKLGYYGKWIEYEGEFEVGSNTTVYAYCTSENGLGETHKRISYLTTGISSPVIKADTVTKAPQVKVEIEYDENAEIMRYRVGDGPLLDYNGAFYVYENTEIYAYNKNSLDYEAESKKVINNIVSSPNYTVIDQGNYFIIKLNYPDVSKTREYKWKQDGKWKEYDSKGILLIKPEYKDEIEIGTDGVIVLDEDGNEVIFTDHYYFIDVAFSELMENLFMRWENEKPQTPEIIINPESATKEVEVVISYASNIVKKYYKVVTEKGLDTGWLEYVGPLTITENNTVIYAKGENSIELMSEVSSKKVTNIDEIAPEISVSGDFTTSKQKVTVKVSAKDDLMMYMVMYAKGEQDLEYFKKNGTSIKNPGTFTVSENGKYTIYAVDQVGNETTKVIEVTNIDKNAPDIIIDVLTESFGLKAEVCIDYSDSKTKEYRIGEKSTEYKPYTENIIIKANDVLDLVNEDGTLTIYAKGTDEAENIKEVSEKIYVLDLDAPKEPIIHAASGYPTLTEYGVKFTDDSYIVYDTRDDIDNYYSVDNGETWKIYTGPFEISSGTIKAKSVKKVSGLTVTATKKVELPSDAIGSAAYDNKDDTGYKLTQKVYRYINISEELINRQIAIKYSYGDFQTIKFDFYNSSGKVVGTKTLGCTSTCDGVSDTEVLKIPSGTIKLGIYHAAYASSSAYIYEISPFSTPILNNIKYYPILTEYGVEAGYNEVTIDYFQTSVERLYRINNGEWKEYQNKKIRLKIKDKIEAKGIDKYGVETKVSSYNAVLPDDSLGANAYDNKDDTSYKLPQKVYKYINISDELINKKMEAMYSYGDFQTIKFDFYNSSGKVVGTKTLGCTSTCDGASGIEVLTIPSGTVKLGFYHTVYATSGAYIYEINQFSSPVINNTKFYPTLTEYGIEPGYNEVTINYFQTSVERLYRINGGEWKEYQGKIRLKIKDKIEAKGIDKYGVETKVSSYTAILPADALDPKIYDGKDTTGIEKPTNVYFNVSEEMQGKSMLVTSNIGEYWSMPVTFLNSSGKTISTTTIATSEGKLQTTVVKIPSNTTKIMITCKTYYVYSSTLYEIRQYFEPIISNMKFYPTLTEHGIESGYNEVTIKYFQTSVQRLYRINGGEWQEYQDKKIRIEIKDKIDAKGIDKYGKETAVTSYTASLPTDALDANVYDGKDTTGVTKPIDKYFNVSEEMQGKSMKVTANIGDYWSLSVTFINSSGTTLSTTKIADTDGKLKDIVVKIPNKTTKIKITSNTYYVYSATLYEISESITPLITQSSVYPTLTKTSFATEYYKVTITYLPHLQKLYSIDNGTIWLEYTGPFEIKSGSVIKAKAIDDDGTVSEIPTHTVTALSDYLPSTAYDNNKSTKATIAKTTTKVFRLNGVDNETMRIYLSGTVATDSYIKFYNSSNTEIGNVSLLANLTTLVIPKGSVKANIYSGSSALNITEINLRSEKVIVTDVPVFETSSLEWTTSKTVEIFYPQGSKNEYSLDLGETWLTYDETTLITVDTKTVVLARTLDENNTLISSSSFTVTTVDGFIPVITYDPNVSLLEGYSYSIPTSYKVGASGGKPVCKIGEETVSNTKGLAAGKYNVDCSLTNGVGVTTTSSFEIEVIGVQETYTFDYTKTIQEFTVEKQGYYMLEAWGAQGGTYSTYTGGYGGYSTGLIYLNTNQKLYIVVGGSGSAATAMSKTVVNGGYNGGGNGYGYSDKYVCSGGGATHIATATGLLSELSAKKSSILIVAAGGGGSGYQNNTYYGYGGSAGGYLGSSGKVSTGSYKLGKGGSQTAAGTGAVSGAFGKGGSSTSNGTGGGAGYYGGASGQYFSGGGGGSSYIGNSSLTYKSMYCYNCTQSTATNTKTVSTTNVSEEPISTYAKIGNGYAILKYFGE